MDHRYIYHICSEEDWKQAKEEGYYQGSRNDQQNGFIHMSFAHQLKESAAKHFRHKKSLLLLKMDYDDLKSQIKLSEIGRKCPHFYGKLAVSIVLKVTPLNLNSEGYPQFCDFNE